MDWLYRQVEEYEQSRQERVLDLTDNKKCQEKVTHDLVFFEMVVSPTVSVTERSVGSSFIQTAGTLGERRKHTIFFFLVLYVNYTSL